MTNNKTSKDVVRAICDQLWAFHNDRLADPSLVKMDSYVQRILEAFVSALPEGAPRAESHQKKRWTAGYNTCLKEVKQTLQAGGSDE